MKLQVKVRRTAWLLTLLLSVAGCFGATAASTTILRASYTIVCVDQAQRPRQEIAEPGKPVPPTEHTAPVAPASDNPAPATLLDPALFQRPPPAISSRL